MNPNNPVSSIMVTQLTTVRPSDPISVVQDIFKRNSFHHLPVLENGGKLVGMISKEDYFRVTYLLSLTTTGKTFTHLEYDRLTAADLMTKYPISLDPDDSIGLAADIFLANKFHALPIVEDEVLLGLITTHDLLQYGFDSPIMEEGNFEYDEATE